MYNGTNAVFLDNDDVIKKLLINRGKYYSFTHNSIQGQFKIFEPTEVVNIIGTMEQTTLKQNKSQWTQTLGSV